jgi:hypothetical protein
LLVISPVELYYKGSSYNCFGFDCLFEVLELRERGNKVWKPTEKNGTGYSTDWTPNHVAIKKSAAKIQNGHWLSRWSIKLCCLEYVNDC